MTCWAGLVEDFLPMSVLAYLLVGGYLLIPVGNNLQGVSRCSVVFSWFGESKQLLRIRDRLTGAIPATNPNYLSMLV